MSSPKKTRFFLLILILSVSALQMSGCTFPSKNNSYTVVSEEAYIDLKLGFSLVIPSTWERVRTPVSSPRYRQNSVEWSIIRTKLKVGTLSVTAKPHSPEPLETQLAAYRINFIANGAENIKAIQLPAGPAVRLEERNDTQTIITIAIEGPDQTYFLTSRLTNETSPGVLPTIEKSILSFSFLAD